MICAILSSFLLMQSLESMENIKEEIKIFLIKKALREFENKVIIPKKIWHSIANPYFDSQNKPEKYLLFTGCETLSNIVKSVESSMDNIDDLYSIHENAIKAPLLNRLLVSIDYLQHSLYENKLKNTEWNKDKIFLFYAAIQSQLTTLISKKNNIKEALEVIKNTINLINNYDNSTKKDFLMKNLFEDIKINYFLSKIIFPDENNKKSYSFRDALNSIVQLNNTSLRLILMTNYCTKNDILLRHFRKTNIFPKTISCNDILSKYLSEILKNTANLKAIKRQSADHFALKKESIS